MNETVSVVAAQIDELDPVKQAECLKMTIEKECPNKNVTFWLYNNVTTNYHLNEFNISTIKEAPFNDRPIKILLHGYNGSKTDAPNTEIRPEYLRLKYNVISIDYGAVAKRPCYNQSVHNAEIVADCFVKFIHLLLNTIIEKRTSKKITTDELHILGFSLGGQISGDTGHKLKHKYNTEIPRLTGLDPAGPLFYGTANRLNQTSATYVDCLHTSPGTFGKLVPVATADFYFNYIILQDGCTTILCNHFRSPEYFAESIHTTSHKFCGKLGILTVIVGEYVKLTTLGVYYVKTNDTKPYAIDAPTEC